MWQKIRSPLLYFSLGINFTLIALIGFVFLSGMEIEYEGHHDWKKKHHHKDKKWDKHDKDPGWYFYKHKIGVSDTQWKKIRPDMETFHRKAYELCKKISELKNDILRHLENENVDSEQLEKKSQEIMSLKQKKHKMFVDYMASKKKYLTSEQQEKFFGMLRKDEDCDKHARFLEDKHHH